MCFRVTQSDKTTSRANQSEQRFEASYQPAYEQTKRLHVRDFRNWKLPVKMSHRNIDTCDVKQRNELARTNFTTTPT